jgi:hypothetical protein
LAKARARGHYKIREDVMLKVNIEKIGKVAVVHCEGTLSLLLCSKISLSLGGLLAFVSYGTPL